VGLLFLVPDPLAFLAQREPGSGDSDPQTPHRVAGWINCGQRKTKEILEIQSRGNS
jgi:hypothetical protein